MRLSARGLGFAFVRQNLLLDQAKFVQFGFLENSGVSGNSGKDVDIQPRNGKWIFSGSGSKVRIRGRFWHVSLFLLTVFDRWCPSMHVLVVEQS